MRTEDYMAIISREIGTKVLGYPLQDRVLTEAEIEANDYQAPPRHEEPFPASSEQRDALVSRLVNICRGLPFRGDGAEERRSELAEIDAAVEWLTGLRF